MVEKIENVHVVIADLDEEMNYMLEHGDCNDIITAEGHKRMIASLDKFCESVGFPCAKFDEESEECEGD